MILGSVKSRRQIITCEQKPFVCFSSFSRDVLNNASIGGLKLWQAWRGAHAHNPSIWKAEARAIW